MRRSAYLIFINAMILIVVMALMTQSLFIVKRLAKVEKLEGRVLIQHKGASATTLAKNDFITVADSITTGSNGKLELKWADGTRVDLEPNTEFSINAATHNMLRKADDSQFGLKRGTIFVRIIKPLTANSKFEVETPTAVTAVRGTVFMVKVEKGQTEVAVHKGSVRVRSSQTGQTNENFISPGQVAFSQQLGQVRVDESKHEDAAVESEFAKHPNIIKPQLTAHVRKMSDENRAIIQGQAEPGDFVTVNGQTVRVLGNGAFLFRVSIKKGLNRFVITCLDRHGASSQITKSLSL